MATVTVNPQLTGTTSEGTLTASKAVVTTAAGNFTTATTTATEIGYLAGSAVTNNRIIKADGSKFTPAAAITANRALASDANGIPVHATTTDTELNYMSGVTSAVQTQLNALAGNPSVCAVFYDDWMESDINGSVKWGGSTAGGGAFSSSPTGSAALDYSLHPGILNLNINANSSRSSIATSAVVALAGNGALTWESSIYLDALSTASEEYILCLGFISSNTTYNQTNAIYLLYDRSGTSTNGTASANWSMCTCDNSTRTITPSSTAVAATTWLNLKIQVNAAATSVNYLVNNVSIGTVSTNIPTATTRGYWIGQSMFKVASGASANNNLYVDYVLVKKQFNSAR